MFERFTERARQVVVLANEEARLFGHNYIGTEHILLGLLREEEGIAARVLTSVGVSLEGARLQVKRIVGTGEEGTHGHIPFTPRAKKVLEIALREARSLSQSYVGTEHILLALVRDNDGGAVRVLRYCGTGPEPIREAVLALPSSPYDPPQRGTASTRATVVPFEVTARPDRKLRRLLRAAGARALADDREEFGLDDLIAAARELHATDTQPDG